MKKEADDMFQCPLDMFSYTVEPGDTLQKIAEIFNSTTEIIASANNISSPYLIYPGEIICIPSANGRRFFIHQTSSDNSYSVTSIDLMHELRRLWQELVEWTRMATLSNVESLDNLNVVINQLLKSPMNFRDFFAVFYGTEVANMSEDLMTEHLVLKDELVKASLANDSQTAMEKEQAWYENADAIAFFLTQINPYWDEEAWKEMMYEYLNLVKNGFELLVTKNYVEEIANYSNIQNQSTQMADYMWEGIIHQFPNRN